MKWIRKDEITKQIKGKRFFKICGEIVFFYGVLVLLNHLLYPDIPVFYGISPHPFWIGVLFFPLRYGWSAGLVSGLVSLSLYLSLVYLKGDPYLFEDYLFYIIPSLFLMVGVLIGVGIESFIRRLHQREDDIEKQKQEISALGSNKKFLESVNAGLEKKIVSQMSTIVTLYSGARKLESLNRETIYPAMLDFFSETLEASESAIYLLEEDRWVLKYQKGWQDYHRRKNILDRTEGLIGQAGSTGKIVSVRDFLRSEKDSSPIGLLGDAMIAGPLKREDGEVIGVYSIQNIPFLRFTSTSLNLLSLLLDWASHSLEKVYYFEELYSKTIIDEIYNVYQHHYFQSRGKQEFLRSKTYYLPFSVVLIRLKNLTTYPKEVQLNLLQVVSRFLNHQSREIDIVTKFGEEDIPFALLLLTTSKEGAMEVCQDLRKSFHQLHLGDFQGKGELLNIEFGVGSFDPKIKTFDQMVQKAGENWVL